MDRAATPLYPNAPSCLIEVFDVRILGAAERLHSERAAWGECGDIETLDQDHYVLIVHPGGAQRLEA